MHRCWETAADKTGGAVNERLWDKQEPDAVTISDAVPIVLDAVPIILDTV